MAGERKLALAGAALVVLLVSPGPSAGADQDFPVVVHLEDQVGIPAQDLGHVRADVDGIFRSAGITLSWAGPLRRPVRDVAADGLRRVAVAIINIEAPFSPDDRASADVLGRAAPALGRAWVFVNRITEVSRNRPIDANVLLARAVAHELGHLLLPPGTPHAAVGLMRPSVELTRGGFHRFTAEEARAMREGLGAHRRAQ